MNITLEPKGCGDIATIMGFAVDMFAIFEVVEAQDTVVSLVVEHGWTEFCEAFERYEDFYGRVTSPYEMVALFITPQELERFKRYWDER